MLTVHATLQPNGLVQLPPSLAKGSVAATLALLRSPEFLALPKTDPQEVEARIQALRNDWDDA